MKIQELNCSNHAEFDQHEQVLLCQDTASGLRALIGLHSTTLGPAAGGTRRWTYADQDAAVADVLRLSRGMSYKNAMAGLKLGGGKAVIMCGPSQPKTDAEFRTFGRFVQSLAGRYVTAEDVGISTDDMRIVHQETSFVSGLPTAGSAAGGDPSPWTALGVFLSLQQAIRRQHQRVDITGISVAVQGVGHVGYHLCQLLNDAGAKLIVADVNPQNVDRARRDFGATVVDPAAILSAEADALAPCALGGVLNAQTIPTLGAPLVAGAANNQLATDRDAQRLIKAGILFLPDYVINAGGIIAVAREYFGGSTRDDVARDVAKIPHRLAQLLDQAERDQLAPSEVADRTARELIAPSTQTRLESPQVA